MYLRALLLELVLSDCKFILLQETPTSDFESNGSIPPSEPSEPTTPLEPFEPKFKVKVTDPVKDGEIVKYTVKTSTVSSSENTLEHSCPWNNS